MSDLDDLRADTLAELIANEDVLYPHKLVWSGGVTCRCSIKDPQQVNTAYAQAIRQQPDALEMRIVKFHPSDPIPAEGASATWLTTFGEVRLTIVNLTDPRLVTQTPLATARAERR